MMDNDRYDDKRYSYLFPLGSHQLQRRLPYCLKSCAAVPTRFLLPIFIIQDRSTPLALRSSSNIELPSITLICSTTSRR